MTSLMGTYNRQPLALVRGAGCVVTDADGNEYLDMVAGIAVSVLGHAHPALTEAVVRQSAMLLHTSNLYYSEPQLELAERLIATAFPSRVFFCNSGAEANEGAIKLARKWGRTHRDGAWQIVCLEGAFHGRTFAALSATANPRYRDPFVPLVDGFTHVRAGDLDAMVAAITAETAAILVEPVLGESGVHPLDDDYLRGLRRLCDERNLLLILDEVQTGMGRTGHWWAHQRAGITPDVMTVAKGLGGGVPIGAVLASPRADVFEPGDHGTTFGGNPLSCAAGCAVIDTITADGLVGNAAALGERLRIGIETLRSPLVASVRGVGLMIGVRLRREVAPAVVAAALRAGLIINATGSRTLRLVPPLIITTAQVDEAVRLLGVALADVAETAG